MARHVIASSGPWGAKRGTLSHFLTTIVAKYQTNLKGGPSGEKTERGTIYSLPVLWYAEKKGKSFWFSSLGQVIQFETINFCRT